MSKDSKYITLIDELLWDAFLAYKSYARTPFEIEIIGGSNEGTNHLTTGTFTGGISGQIIAKLKIEVTQVIGLGNWFLFEPDDISRFFNKSTEFKALAYTLQGINDFFTTYQIQNTQITLKTFYHDDHARNTVFYQAVNRLIEPLVVKKTT
ncbi:hypothetical protein [uncultured Microscilla sp.]|uniref:hypothetical protein n=1 Tax=uncultured Microscilla sp. TaxID=432653 RepID=UPI00260244B4|nr:hypothetical protein [uncultured Microscilla sp.]